MIIQKFENLKRRSSSSGHDGEISTGHKKSVGMDQEQFDTKLKRGRLLILIRIHEGIKESSWLGLEVKVVECSQYRSGSEDGEDHSNSNLSSIREASCLGGAGHGRSGW